MRKPRFLLYVGVFCAATLMRATAGFSEPSLAGPSEPSLTDPAPDWQKMAWIDHAARALRAGRGLDPQNATLNLSALAALPKDQIVDRLLADPLFGDAVLDFNLYFLGAKPNQVTTDDHRFYQPGIYDFPQAISSAREAIHGGDFLKLLDYRQPVFLGLFGRPTSQDPADQGKPDALVRQHVMARYQSQVDELIAWVQQHPGFKPADFCAQFAAKADPLATLGAAGLPGAITFKIALAPDWYGGLELVCLSNEQPQFDVVAALQAAKLKNAQLFASIAALEGAMPAQQSSVDAIQALDTAGIGASLSWNQFGQQAMFGLPNSSTNRDRKRAAYMLKRFFCDDLTPIAIENPVAHAQDHHGSDPSCLSCHYKLDPMAGFFRDNGIYFSDFSQSPRIVFDDRASADRAAYQALWKAPAGSGREWDVGYVRSVNRTELNDYGSSLEDLFKIIRKAPETRSCLVRRMFEYFAGEDRMLDAGYLAYLTQAFNDEAAAGSSAAALKSTVKRILLSNSFSQSNPVQGQCYDFAPGTVPGSQPPCAVAYVLQQNCIKCHASAETGKARLDLAHWALQPDGHYSFPFQDEHGAQRTRKDTFDRLIGRLTASDSDDRMPPLPNFMSSGDREQLYLWARGQAEQRRD